jgi:type IV pilus assembly protein PilQ
VTSVIVKSGETVVMGGLIRDDEITTTTKVPILGDIPFLGNLFKREQKTQTKRNLVIFITATLITPEGLVAGR